MSRTPSRSISRTALLAIVLASALLGGCAVVTVASTAVGIAATGVGLAVDATAGAVRLTGRALGGGSDSEPAK